MPEYGTCKTCYAVVRIDDADLHMQWHEDLRDFIRDTLTN